MSRTFKTVDYDQALDLTMRHFNRLLTEQGELAKIGENCEFLLALGVSSSGTDVEVSQAHGLHSLLFVTRVAKPGRKEVEAPDEITSSIGIGASESVLAGCSASPATTTSNATSTAAPATIPPTPTTDRDPFQVDFLQHYQVIPCPAEPGPTNLCYTLQDDPSTSSLGTISFNGTDILYVLPEGTHCGLAERHGSLKLADGDTITIHATGKYCVPSYPVQFTFTVTGGTGKYRHAFGRGTIAVGPARNNPPTATEFWSGSIRQS